VLAQNSKTTLQEGALNPINRKIPFGNGMFQPDILKNPEKSNERVSYELSGISGQLEYL
jgi:hypothetical protein